jgi:UMP-CMP kinase
MPKWLNIKKAAVIPEARPVVILVLGGPGAGKGTMSKRIAEEFKYIHLSTGDLLREERARPGSDMAQIIEEHLMQGKLVPDDITVNVLLQAIEKVPDKKHAHFVIDGFPRDVAQMETFKNIIGPKVILKSCLFFDCNQATMKSRLLAYGNSEYARDDDIEKIIDNRIATFRQRAGAVQRYFQYDGMLERIDANRDMEKVWVDVQQYFVMQSYREHEHHGQEVGGGSPVKAIWKLREKQVEEIFPTGHSHTAVTSTKETHARNFTSYTILSRHRDKHTRNMKPPMEHFHEPQTLAQEIGWHQPEEGEDIGAKGTPRGMNTPRQFYPKNTCQMTRHLENMYSTNAQHIIRRW